MLTSIKYTAPSKPTKFFSKRISKVAPSRSRYQHGASLIEVLVSIVVLSIGLLGMAALQITALKNVHGSHFRAQAAQYAYDMADRMRANRNEARSGAYDLDMDDDAPAGTDLADVDRAQWLADVGSLPAGDGEIAFDATTDTLAITVQWNDERGGGDDEASLTFDTQL